MVSIRFILRALALLFFAALSSGTVVSISAGQDIQTAINNNPTGTTFQLAAGTWTPSSTITLKTNDILIGKGSTTIIKQKVALVGGSNITNVAITTAGTDCVTISGTTVAVEQCLIGPCGGRGVYVQSGSSQVYIYDSYIHSEHAGSASDTDVYDSIFVESASNVNIQGNVIAYGETNIEMTGASHVTITGNFLLNPLGPADPRGQQVQSWSSSSYIVVQNNYAVASVNTTLYKYAAVQEDAFNFGSTTNVNVTNNWITGGLSDSGCGLIADYAANKCYFYNNTLYMTGQCGISIASGTTQQVLNNRILNSYLPDPNGDLSNTAITVYNQYTPSCGPVSLQNNIAYATLPNGQASSYWNAGNCGTVTNSGNTFGSAAQTALSPINTKFPPPQWIPPLPKKCVINTPYSKSKSGSFC